MLPKMHAPYGNGHFCIVRPAATGCLPLPCRQMTFPIKVCVVCSEEFELKPDKPGFANRCPECSAPAHEDPITKRSMDADERKTASEANEARRQAMRELLYRKDS
jgi:hypothetical protein